MSPRLGAALALDARHDVVGEVRAQGGGRGADCAAARRAGTAAFDQAVDATRPGGRVLVFAATSPGETVAVDLGRLTSRRRTS